VDMEGDYSKVPTGDKVRPDVKRENGNT